MKICSACKIEKDEIEFSRQNSTKDGLQYNCKSCNADYARKNADRIRLYRLGYYEENKEKILDQRKEYYGENKEQITEYKKEYYKDNVEYIKKERREYCRQNPDKVNALVSKRRAKKLESWLTLSFVEQRQILEFYTEARRLTRVMGVKYVVDHIIPLQGKEVQGPHKPWNLQILTATENSRKGNKTDCVTEALEGRILHLRVNYILNRLKWQVESDYNQILESGI